ncbi:MAG: hypothetical protein AAGI01_17850, partial [Myxococcota bacterium]
DDLDERERLAGTPSCAPVLPEGVGEAVAQQVPLPGAISSMDVDPLGQTAYVTYTDRPFLSVVWLDPTLPEVESCLDAGAAPCEVARIGLTTGCADGIDNDGDGLADAQDPQCFGPLHAEDATGISRRAVGTCADGEDNDGDGVTDRDDPSCVLGEGDEGGAPSLDVAPGPCDDGQDNDGDGLSDAADPGCYGASGRTEVDLIPTSFGQVSVDELGQFAYVLHPSLNEVLVVDIKRRALIDVGAMDEPRDAPGQGLGVTIGRTVVPTAVQGHVERVVTSSDTPGRQLVTYTYSAYVATNSELVYLVDAVQVQCDVTEFAGVSLTEDLFYDDPELLARRNEAVCTTLPSFPLTQQDLEVESCFDDDVRQSEACALNHRVFEDDPSARRVVNPRFDVRDTALSQNPSLSEPVCNARALGISADCSAKELPQPVSFEVGVQGLDALQDFDGIAPVSLRERLALGLSYGEGDTPERATSVVADSFELASGTYLVIYEGAIPGTGRDDGVVRGDGETPRFDVGSLDVCATGIEAGVDTGDLLVLTTRLDPDDGNDACAPYLPKVEEGDANMAEG